MRCRFAVIVSTALLMAGLGGEGVWADSDTVTVGVLAHRGDDTCVEMWTPTVRYLSDEIPAKAFQLLPLDLDGMAVALEQRQVDFVLTNPGHYVELERGYGVTRIATLRNLRHGKAYTLFGAVIFTRAEREDLRTLADLKNVSFGAVDESAFGGFQMAWRALKDAGIDPFKDFSRLRFYGFPQDQIVLDVRDEKIDAGTVRTDTLERMAADGQIRLEDFSVLNQRESEGFPFQHSTRLYPEWAFAKAGFTPDKLAETVAIALMKMPENHPAAAAGKYAGWTVPLNYQPVHELLMELEIGPYRKSGTVSFREVMKQYWYWFLLLLAAIVFSVFHNFLVKHQVTLRTRELSKTNRVLKNEVAERRNAEQEARRLLDEKRFLAQKCMQVQEAERHHLARELHDELGQCITAIQADAEIIHDLAKGCDARLQASAGAIKGVSSRVYEVVHSMMQRLRPSMLDNVGLVETLKEEVAAWETRQPDTRYRLDLAGNLDAMGEGINICIYRIVQECLTNIAKHAMASEVVIRLEMLDGSRPESVRIQVSDNGVGMGQQSFGRGFGLIGMRERVETMNGEFGFSALPGGGTDITVRLPLTPAEGLLQH